MLPRRLIKKMAEKIREKNAAAANNPEAIAAAAGLPADLSAIKPAKQTRRMDPSKLPIGSRLRRREEKVQREVQRMDRIEAQRAKARAASAEAMNATAQGAPANENAQQRQSFQSLQMQQGMTPEQFAAANAQAKEQMAARRQARRAQFDAAMNAGSQKTLAQLDEERAAQLAAFNPNYTRG